MNIYILFTSLILMFINAFLYFVVNLELHERKLNICMFVFIITSITLAIIKICQ